MTVCTITRQGGTVHVIVHRRSLAHSSCWADDGSIYHLSRSVRTYEYVRLRLRLRLRSLRT